MKNLISLTKLDIVKDYFQLTIEGRVNDDVYRTSITTYENEDQLKWALPAILSVIKVCENDLDFSDTEDSLRSLGYTDSEIEYLMNDYNETELINIPEEFGSFAYDITQVELVKCCIENDKTVVYKVKLNEDNIHIGDYQKLYDSGVTPWFC